MSRENAQNFDTQKPLPPRPLARPSELLALLLLLGLLTGLYYRRPQNAQSAERAALYREDQLLLSIDLEDPTSPGTYEIPEEPGFVIEVGEDRAVRVQSSPCPDKLCVRTGWLRHPGEQAICLPLKMLLSVEGPSEDSEDTGFDVVLGDGAYDPYLTERSENETNPATEGSSDE